MRSLIPIGVPLSILYGTLSKSDEKKSGSSMRSLILIRVPNFNKISLQYLI